MARKKQEIALQTEIETQDEWEEMLAKDGLTIVDVYQEWCGPCKAMLGNFRRVKNELGDDLLRFAIAKADTVDALEPYRGKCEPCFQMYGGGSLVSVLRGVNAPLIMRTLTEMLAQEHKVIDGTAERKTMVDPLVASTKPKAKGAGDGEEESCSEEEEEVEKEVTVAIIKPDAVEAGKVDEIIEKLEERGIEVLKKEERILTEDEAREFYDALKDEEFYDDLVAFMASGPSCVLVLSKGETGENVINEFRELIGPKNVEEAKENAPESLRALYGKEKYANALHGSDSKERVNKELAFFFPEYAVPKSRISRRTAKTKRAPRIQRTLALIRPDALKNHKDEILAKIKESGFEVALQKEMHLSREQAEEFYKEHKDQEYFDELVTRMSSGPLLALGLARTDAVTGWRNILGPKEVSKAKEEEPESLRALFADDDVPVNPLHGSDSPETAQKEIEFFFGEMEQTIAAVKPDGYQTKDEIMAKIREAGFRIAAQKETELTKEVAEQFYKDQSDKDYFGDLTDHMSSGPTLFLVLSREDAVCGWREIIGPTDPEVAKEQNPESLRAQFGKSIKENAVHGSSNKDHAYASMNLIFGEQLEFNADGTVKGAESDEHSPPGSAASKRSSRPGSAASKKASEAGSRPCSAGSKKGSQAGSRPGSAGSKKGDEEGEQRPGSAGSQKEGGSRPGSAGSHKSAKEGEDNIDTYNNDNEEETTTDKEDDKEEGKESRPASNMSKHSDKDSDCDKKSRPISHHSSKSSKSSHSSKSSKSSHSKKSRDLIFDLLDSTDSDCDKKSSHSKKSKDSKHSHKHSDSSSSSSDEEKKDSKPPSRAGSKASVKEEEEKAPSQSGSKQSVKEEEAKEGSKPPSTTGSKQSVKDGQQEQEKSDSPAPAAEDKEEAAAEKAEDDAKEDSAEEKKDDAEQKNDDAEQKNDDAEQKNDDSEQKNDDDTGKTEDPKTDV